MSKVYIEKSNKCNYPDWKNGFAPSEKYPEYRWNDISNIHNHIYDVVRKALCGYGFDREHFGTEEWNPLGGLISPGDTVLIKPNWVMHYNENASGGTDCLFTNTSITRAIVDYVFIALAGRGKIFVADSPMPDCNFEKFFSVAHLDELRNSCEERGIDIEIKDLRGDVVRTFSKERIVTTQAKGVEVDLGNDSYFVDLNHPEGSLRYSFLDAKKMNEYYHSNEHHRYVISDVALNADVIINLPKIKTHRKAGYTAALKNYIGICYRKDAIPHFVKGNVAQGGDEYNGPRAVFETESNIRDKENYFEEHQKRTVGLILKALRIPFFLYRRLFAEKYQGIGNWHGNDTIWRAVLDINRIIYYADKNGCMQDTFQRKFFSLGDMIVAGEHNGPLSPSPKECGAIICSENPIAFDRALVRLMGFNEKEIPLFRGIKHTPKYNLELESDKDISITIDDKEIHCYTLEEVTRITEKSFKPADGWDCILK